MAGIIFTFVGIVFFDLLFIDLLLIFIELPDLFLIQFIKVSAWLKMFYQVMDSIP